MINQLRFTAVLLIANLLTFSGASARKDVTFKKSWIWIDHVALERVLVEGETYKVPVEYYLDSSEDDGQTTLMLWGAGPWIDCPDGTYTTRRQHISYPGMRQNLRVKAGQGRHVFTFKVPPAQQRNSLTLIAMFTNAAGQVWPWEVRCSPVFFHRAGGDFELETDQPGNLFTYEEPVRLKVRLRRADPERKTKTLTYRVKDYTGAQVAQGAVTFVPEAAGQIVPLNLQIARRGTFLLEAEVPGWEKRHLTFARIPDLMAITRGQPTQFGMTNVIIPGAPKRIEELCRIARRLGLTVCRSFMNWNEIEPARGLYKLDAWDQPIELARKHGITPWFCIVNPPAWAQSDRVDKINYRAFRGDLDAWRNMVRTVTTRYRGRFWGWEWLNEIVPGGTETPVEDYLQLVRAGTASARAVAPEVKIQLAGGLWPRTFRQAVLKAGAGEYVDVLPVHYSTGGAVREAMGDLETAGVGSVEVWDNETARGISIWDAPPEFDLTHTLQSNWILTNWADELTAGCRRIIYFGGAGDPAGNWSYLLDDLSPRPAAATIAVFVSKVHGAKPLGAFSLGQGGMFHLFDQNGKAVMIASSYVEGETVPLHVGANVVQVVDYQGNLRPVASTGGVARLTLSGQRYYVDGADLDVLKSYLVPDIDVRQAAPVAQGHLKDTAVLVGTPKTTMLRGGVGQIMVRLRNLYSRQLEGTFRLTLPTGWKSEAKMNFSLRPHQSTLIPVAVKVPEGTQTGDHPVQAVFDFAWNKLPTVTKPLIVSVISPDALGNQLTNGDFEEPATPADRASGWSGNGKRVTASGLGLGHYALKFTDTGGGWQHHTKTIAVRPGETYLYTAWVWNQNMHAGSNLTLHFADGTERRLYDVNVFTCGESNPSWQFYTARFQAPSGTTSVSVTPVVQGSGWALFDNLRITAYEGTDFAAGAYRVAKPPVIDGRLDDWLQRDALPLIGKNQLTVWDGAYQWSPDNLSGVAYLSWDDQNLYIAAYVRDNAHHATTTGETTPEGDSLILAFDPSNRSPDSAQKAFAYYVSAASPGGGSGKHTLYRPPSRSAGLSAGQLAKDSSTYDLAIVRSEGVTTYELRVPFSELGGILPAIGSKFGFSVQLNDNDGATPLACMNWGEGITPAWTPQNFGVVTFIK